MKSLWCFLRLQVFYCLQLWLWGIDVYVYQRYRINFEFIFGKYQPYLLHALDQFRIASRYTVFMLILVNVWYYCAFIAKTLTLRQIPFIAPISFVCLLGQIVPMPGEVFTHEASVVAEQTQVVHAATLRFHPLCSLLHGAVS